MIYENIKRLCKKRGVSVAALEVRLNIGNGTIGKGARIHSNPRADTLKKIADYFGVTLDDLLKEDEEEPPSGEGGDEDFTCKQ